MSLLSLSCVHALLNFATRVGIIRTLSKNIVIILELYLYIFFWAIFDHPCIIFVARERRQIPKPLFFALPLISIPMSFTLPWCLSIAQSGCQPRVRSSLFYIL